MPLLKLFVKHTNAHKCISHFCFNKYLLPIYISNTAKTIKISLQETLLNFIGPSYGIID